MNGIAVRSHAKINLGLDVTGVLPSGYHTVKMIMQTITLCDTLYFEKKNSPGIKLKTNLPYLPVNGKNLVHKAITLFMEKYGLSGGIYCTITKRIPVAAGLAGGSGNAAAALIAMNRLFDKNLSEKELMEMGLELGADVPYCIMGKTALAEGIGEVLTPLPSPPRAFVLVVKPGVSVSTADIYHNLVLDENTVHPDIDACLRAIHSGSLTDLCQNLGNILEDVTVKLHPAISDIKKEMLTLGAKGALMSGSGPTVFGLFDDEALARAALKHFKDIKEYSRNTELCEFT